MRIYIILFFLVTVIFTSCKSELPPGVLNHEQMAEVLTDVHIVDGSLAIMPQYPDSLYKYGTGKYLQVFKQHHTDSAQFRKSFEYYTRKPDQLNEVYTLVIKRIKAKADSLTKSMSKPKNAVSRK